jgi:hypothetical protein
MTCTIDRWNRWGIKSYPGSLGFNAGRTRTAIMAIIQRLFIAIPVNRPDAGRWDPYQLSPMFCSLHLMLGSLLPVCCPRSSDWDFSPLSPSR